MYLTLLLQQGWGAFILYVGVSSETEISAVGIYLKSEICTIVQMVDIQYINLKILMSRI